MFLNNEKRFYQGNGKAKVNEVSPDPQAASAFWQGIWSENYEHRKDTE